MSTAAVSIEKKLQTQDYIQTIWKDGSNPERIIYGTSMTVYLKETRPPSVKRTKSASGWRNPTNWSHYRMACTPAPLINLMLEQYSKTGTINVYGDGNAWTESVASLPPYPSNLEQRAVVKALLALKGQNVNYAQAFAERSQTARMFSSGLADIAKQVRNFRSRRPKDWLRALKYEGRNPSKVPESWLSLQYGWRPFMADVQGACKDLSEMEKDGDAYRCTVHGTLVEKSRTVRRRISGISGNAGIDIDQSVLHACKVRLDYVLEDPITSTLAQTGITNPLALAWELVPYSFVIDWALPIGDYLSCLDAALGWGFKAGSRTKFTRLTERGQTLWTKKFSSQQGYTWLGSPGSYSADGFSMDRLVYASSPLPRFPGIKNPLSTGHVANAMSLLVTAFR